jgi:hypothetical protein
MSFDSDALTTNRLYNDMEFWLSLLVSPNKIAVQAWEMGRTITAFVKTSKVKVKSKGS